MFSRLFAKQLKRFHIKNISHFINSLSIELSIVLSMPKSLCLPTYLGDLTFNTRGRANRVDGGLFR